MKTKIHVEASIPLGRIPLCPNQTLFEYHWPLTLIIYLLHTVNVDISAYISFSEFAKMGQFRVY